MILFSSIYSTFFAVFWYLSGTLYLVVVCKHTREIENTPAVGASSAESLSKPTPPPASEPQSPKDKDALNQNTYYGINSAVLFPDQQNRTKAPDIPA
ncbi:unnamed protein product, partial [Mesorhabditis spiculigera]